MEKMTKENVFKEKFNDFEVNHHPDYLSYLK